MAGDQSISPNRRPNSGFVLAVTVALWTYLFASVAADALLDSGWNGGTIAGILGLFLGCAVGIAMCLGLETVARRFVRAGPAIGIGLIALACICAAIMWTAATRLLMAPMARLLAETAGFPEAPGPYAQVATPWIALIFLAWAGYWLAVSFADRISLKEDEVRKAESRIVELEALLGEAKPSTSYVSLLWVPSRNGPRRLEIGDLLMVKAERDYVRLIASEGRDYLVRSTLHRLLARLDPACFVQVNRSSIVNIGQIVEVRRSGTRTAVLELSGGQEARVSRRFIRALGSLPSAGGTR